MNKRTGSNLTALFCSVALTFLCGPAYSQNIAINPDDCTATENLQTSNADSMAIRLSCYNQKLDSLTDVLSGLITERNRLNGTIGTLTNEVAQEGQQLLVTDNATITEQQQTIQQLQLERAELRAQLHRLLSENQTVQLDKDTDERLFRNYSDAYTALSIENDELRKLLAEYQISATGYQASAQALESSNEEKSAQIVQLSNEIANLKLTIADLSSRRKKLTNEFSKAESNIGLLKKQLLANATLITLQRDDISALQQAQSDGVSKLESADQNLTNAKQRHAETVANLIATKEKLYSQISALDNELDQTTKQGKQASFNALATLSSRDKEISDLKNKLISSNDENSAQIDQLSTEISHQNLTITDLSTHKKNLTNEFSKAESNIGLLKKQLLANATLITIQSDDITLLQQAQNDSASKLDSADQNLIKVKKRHAETVANLIATKEKLHGQINALNDELDRTTQQGKQASLNALATLSTRDREISDLSNKLKSNKEEKSAQKVQLSNEISNLKLTIADLSTLKNNLTNEVSKAESNIGLLKKQLLANATMITIQSDNISSLQQAQSDSASQLESADLNLTSIKKRHAGTVTNLIATKEKLHGQINALNDELDRTTQQGKQASLNALATLSTRDREISDLSNKLKSNKEEKSAQKVQLSNEISNLKLTIADLSTRKRKLTNKFSKAESYIGLLKKQLLANATLITVQSDDITSLQLAQNDSASKLESANQNLTIVKQQINTLDDELDQTTTQGKQAFLNALATLSTRDKEISNLSNKLTDLRTAHEEVNAKLSITEQDLNAANDAYTAEIGELNEKNSALNASNIDLTKALNTKSEEIKDLQNKLFENDGQLAQLNGEISELETNLANAKKATSELTQGVDTAQNENTVLTEQLQTKSTQLNALQNERDRLAAELNVSRPEITTLSNNIETKELENEKLSQSILALKSNLTQEGNKTGELQELLKTSENKNAAATDKIDTLTAAVSSLENILDESLSNNKQFEASLADIKTDLQASQNRLDAKKVQLQELMAEKTALINAHNALATESQELTDSIKQNLKANNAEAVSVVRMEDNSLVLNVDSSQLFRTGSSRLSAEGQELLASVAQAIGSVDNRRIMIEGHSDNVPLGQKLSAIFKDNLGLSMSRALSTAQFFTDSAGIPADKMSVSGAGATRPLASNETTEGRQKNRRVEILLLPVNGDRLASIK